MKTKNETSLTSEELIEKLQAELARERAANANLSETNASLHAERASLKADNAILNEKLDVANAEIDNLHAEVEESRLSLDLNSMKIASVTKDAEKVREDVKAWLRDGLELSPDERRRLNGSGVSRWGLISKIAEVMQINPEFAPQFLDVDRFQSVNRRLEGVRNLTNILHQSARVCNDVLLILSDEAFRMALSYYVAVRDAAHRRIPGALELFRILRPFFRRRHISDIGPEQPPTEAEILRDVKAGLRRKKDVDIHIIHEDSHREGGKHVVIDKTRTGHSSFTKTENMEIDE